jgi:hypothetical protein
MDMVGGRRQARMREERPPRAKVTRWRGILIRGAFGVSANDFTGSTEVAAALHNDPL